MGKAKKIAVTGANGFIGAHCVLALLKVGFEVVAVVRDPSNPSKTQFLRDEASKLQKEDLLSFGAGDLSKEGSYDDALEGTWGVLHTAAVVQLGNVPDAYEAVVKPAIEGTKIIVDSIKKQSLTIQRFVNISSIAAVISVDQITDEKIFGDADWNTYSTIEKGDAYGYAKTHAEKVVSDDEELAAKIETIVSINPSIVLGPCFTKSHANGGSASIVTAALTGTPLDLHYMNLVDVRDVAKGAVLAFQQGKEEVGGKRFILNATEAVHVDELSAMIQKVHPSAKGTKTQIPSAVMSIMVWVGKNLPFFAEWIGYTDYWDAWDARIRLDNSRSKTVLGIGEYMSMEDTCRDAAVSIEALIGDNDATSSDKK
jgi:nucleoside-diphosphate-sugar epimerase